jgi:galactose-1-phosphate uridylyltransferase
MDQINRKMLASLLQVADISTLSLAGLDLLFREEENLSRSLPDGTCQIDPRNGDHILYVSRRGFRPHDNRPAQTADPPTTGDCPICQGKTTGVIDIAELSEGVTFINKNLFPVVYPFDRDETQRESNCPTRGYHFLQWTSSLHNKDWHNMPVTDGTVVFRRLAALEKKLLETGQQVLITKNYGRLVGGSLFHGHQQIILTPLLPNRFLDNHRFLQEKGETFSSYLLRQNPPELLLRDYSTAVLLVPYFIHRPYEMMLLLKNTSQRYLHDLSEQELSHVARGWRDAIHVMRSAMPAMDRETAYNITCHNGPGAGLYFEFLPYTQESGGLEHLGLFACQADPYIVAGHIRSILAQ